MSEWTPPANATLVEEEVETNGDTTVEVETTEEWTPPANAVLVEEDESDKLELIPELEDKDKEKLLKEAKTWVTPKMIEEAKKEFNWEDGQVTDDQFIQAWDFYKSKELKTEEKESTPVFNTEGEIVAEETTTDQGDVIETETETTTVSPMDDPKVESVDFTTLVSEVKFEDADALSKKRFKNEQGEEIPLSELNDYLTKKGERLIAEKEKDFEIALGKPLSDFKTDEDGSIILDNKEQVEAFKGVIAKYKDVQEEYSKEIEDANALLNKYSILGSERDRKRKLKQLEKAHKKEQDKSKYIEEVDSEGKPTGRIFSYQKAKEIYVDLPKSRGIKGFEIVADYIKAYNRGTGRSGNKLQIGSLLPDLVVKAYDDPTSPEAIAAVKKAKKEEEEKRFRKKNWKWWNDLLGSDEAEAIFTFSEAKGKDYLDHFLPSDFETKESGSLYITDWVTVVHKPTGDEIEIGFDYDSEDRLDIWKQQNNLMDFLFDHTDEEDLEESFTKAKNAYAIYKEAEKTDSRKGGFNVDWKKEEIENFYQKPGLFEPKIERIERKGSRVVSSTTGNVVDSYSRDKYRKEMGESERIAQAEAEVKQRGGVRKIYNPRYVDAQRDALKQLIEQKKELGIKAEETIPLHIGAGGSVVRPETKGLGITQEEVNNLARKILANEDWEAEQRRAFENYVESDKYWNQEEEDQTRIMFGNITDRSIVAKKAIATDAMFKANLDELEEFEANPATTRFTKEFKAFKENKNIAYNIEEGESYYVIDGRKVPAYIIDGAKQEQETYKKLIRNVEMANGAAQYALDQVPKFDEKWEIYSKNYNDLERAGKALTLGIGDVVLSLGYGAYKLQSYVNPFNYTMKYLGIDDPITEGMLGWSSWKQKELSEYAPVARFGEWNTWGEFGSYWMNVGAEQAPIYMTMIAANMIAPGSGFAIAGTAGLTNLGQTDIRMREEVALGREDWTEGDIMFRSLLSGTNEGFFTYFGTAPILRKGGSILTGKGGKPFRDFATGRRNYIKQQFPGILVDGAKEASEEIIIAFGDNIIFERPWNQGLLEAGAVGGMLGVTTTGSPATYNLIANNFTNGDQLNKLSANIKAKADIYNENEKLREENTANIWEAANTSDQTKKAQLKQTIDNNNSKIENNLKVEEQLNEETTAIYEEIDNNLKNQGLGKDSYENYSEAATEMAVIKAAAQQIEVDPTKTNEQKAKEIEILGNQYTNMKNALDIYSSTKLFGHGYYALLASSYINNKKKRQLAELRGEATTRILAKKGSNYEISPKELNTESAKIYIEQEVDKQLAKDQKANKDLKVVDTKAEAVRVVNEHYDPKISNTEDQKQKDKLIKAKQNVIEKINSGQSNGVYLETGITEEFIVVKETMVNNEKVYTGAHENTHGWVSKLMKENPKAFEDLGNQIVKYMQTSNPDVWEKMIKQNPGIKNQDQNSKDFGKIDLEEVIASFVEEIGQGNIKLNKRGVIPAVLGKLLNNGIEKASKGKNRVPFKGQNDIVNWFTSIGQSIVNGDIDLRKKDTPIIPIDEQVEVDTDVKVAASETTIKQKESANRAGDNINAAIGNVTTPAEVQAEVYTNFLSEDAPAKTSRLIDNVIKQQLSKEGVNVEGADANVYNQPLDQFIQEVKDQLLDKSVMRFDETKAVKKPDGSFDVGGYLISELVKYRIGDVLKKYKPKAGQKSLDVTDTEGRTIQYEDVGAEQDIISRIDEGEQIAPESTFRRGIKFQNQDKPGLTDEQVESFKQEAVEVSKQLPPVEDKKFRPKLDQLAGTKLKKWVKDNVFKGQKYPKFIEDNYNLIRDLDVKYLIDLDKGLMKQGKDRAFTKPVRRLTTQEDIRKYKDSGRVYVEDEAQGVMLYDVLDPGVDFMIDFFTKEMPSTVSNRKGKLAEAFGRKMFKDALPEIKSQQDISTAEKSKVSEKIQRDPRLKFSQKTVENKSVNLATKLDNIVKKAGYEALLRGKEGVEYMTDFITEDMAEVFGPAVYSFIRPSTLAGAGNNVIGKKKNSGALGRGFMFINDPSRATVAKEVVQQYVDAGEVGSLTDLKNKLKEKGITPLTKKEQTAVETAVVSQKITNLQRNLQNINQHKKGIEDIIRGLREVFDLNNENVKGIRELIYHPNANASWGRNLAAVLGLQDGASKGNAYEEHVFQFGNWAVRTLQAIANKNKNADKVLDGYINWVKDNYYQIAFNKSKNAENKTNQGIVDGTYDVSRFNPEEKLEKWKAKHEEHPLLKEALDEAFKTGDFSKVPNADIRFYNEYFYLNPNEIIREGITDAKRYNVEVSAKDAKNASIQSRQAELIFEVIKGNITKADAKKQLDAALPYLRKQIKPTELNAKNNNKSKVVKQKFSVSNTDSVRQAEILDRALNIARDPNAPVKKIRVFDFDDTLARTKSNVLYTMPDGKTGKLTAEEFAKRGTEMLEQGAEFDFSEFNKVMEGKKGPLFEVAKKIQEARGTKDIFVLTARAAEAAPAIKEFLDSVGLNIPLENITGLGDSSPLAKSGWIVGKAAEGYNDFYFADDHLGNVDAVKRVLDVIDVKSKVQQAKVKFSNTADKMMNNIIYQKTGIEQYKQFSEIAAQARGRKKKSFSLIPSSAQDFGGLLYKLLAKGEAGDVQWQWMQDNLIKPYGRAMNDLSVAQNQLMADFRELKNSLQGVPKNLKKKAIDGFTNEDIVRVLAWDRQGIKVEGLSKRDLDKMKKYVENKPDLNAFVTELIAITKGDGYHYPGPTWLAGTITTDFMEGLRKTTRPKLLQQWQENVDLAFNESNMNKLEAAFGSKYREALENALERMKTGRNRRQGMGRLEQRFLDYLNNSVGAVMFLNARSAVLQTISAVNFVNWTDNNPIKAGAAFANQPQYWKDFIELMNSDFLVDRRNGLKINVSESEIAEAAKTTGNSVKGVISYLLNKGFVFTQIADSFAIASGGATFYRNRIKTYMKEGMSEAEAKEKAFLEFRDLAEESQQSSRADKISQQQASTLGRIVLAFANTPSQYARIMDKAGRDLINGRGDWKSNISKIMYYGFVQNLLFTTLQQAIFAVAGEEDEEEIEDKTINAANSMLDNILRGLGVQGTIISASKNVIVDLIKRSEKDPYFNPDADPFPGPRYEESVFKLIEVSPPLAIKLKKWRSGWLDYQFNRWRPEASEWFNINNPNYRAASKIIASVTNVPLDRLFQKIENIQGAMDETNEPWQRVAMFLGWPKWQLETTAAKEERKTKEKEQKKAIKAIDKPSIYTKEEQVNILKQYDLTDEEIKELKNEDLRVEKIKELRDSTKVIHTPKATHLKPVVKETLKPVTPKTDSTKVTFITTKPATKKSERKKITIENRTARQARLYKLSKANQIDTLRSLGVTPEVIKTLKYEEDRVRKIEELYDKD